MIPNVCGSCLPYRYPWSDVRLSQAWPRRGTSVISKSWVKPWSQLNGTISVAKKQLVFWITPRSSHFNRKRSQHQFKTLHSFLHLRYFNWTVIFSVFLDASGHAFVSGELSYETKKQVGWLVRDRATRTRACHRWTEFTHAPALAHTRSHEHAHRQTRGNR